MSPRTRRILIRGGTVVTADSASVRDLLVEGETIAAAVRDGMISQVSSDDAAYSWEAKLLGAGRFDLCPNGIPGVEVRLPLLYSEGVVRGRMSLPRLVEVTAAAPARLFGLAPRKGSLEPGADADIVLFDPKAKWIMGRETLHMDAALEEKYFRTAKAAIGEDAAEVIVLGCAGLAGLDKRLQERLGIPVLDGVVCALIIAFGLSRYGVSTSKARRYNPE